MSGFTTSRRRLLSALGLGAGSLFLPSLLPKARSASAPIKRILFIVSPHQMILHGWEMRRGNPVGPSFEYRFDDVPASEFSPTLAPFAPYKDRLLVIEGPSIATAHIAQRYFNGHDASHMDLLTGGGFDTEDASNAHGPSVDQIIARAIADPDRISSLELGKRQYQGGFVNAGPNQRLPLEESPAAVFNRLFPNPDEADEPTEASLIRQARADVLDTVQAEFEAKLTHRRLSSEDRQKLEQHRALVGDLQRRIGVLDGLTCEVPDQQYEDSVSHTVEHALQMGQLIAAAFACDLTRVATLQLKQLANAEFDAPPGDVHQDFAHQADADENARAEMLKFNRVYSDLVAGIVGQIAQYTDGEGSLLDNTLIVWMNEHGLHPEGGAHLCAELPVVIAGNVDGYFDTGRYLSLPRDVPQPIAPEPFGPPHNKLLVSLMHAMGVEQNSIGVESYRDSMGGTVDMTGPLPELDV